MFQKWFDVDVLRFQIEFRGRYFGLFWLGDCLGYFKISNRLVTLFILDVCD
jgi:hypothetical protein